ncbi:MAG: flagellar motor switch protein FliM [Firmicutes bacterium]|nr:flagellar motor switch protein FliM [Bacillota bacterium]
MQDILSQQEIDDLLASISTGDMSAEKIEEQQAEGKVQPYDFRRPNRFSKDQVRTLEMIHENFARLLSTFFSAHLRTAVEVKLLSVQELSYDEFIRSLLNPTVMALFQIEGLRGEMLMEFNPVLAFSILERLLGGKSDGGEQKRALTEIEQTIILRLTRQVVRVLGEAWSNILSIEGRVGRLETNPLFVHIVAGNEMVALVSLEININGAYGLMNLCFPYILLKPITGKLSARYWFSSSGQEGVQATEQKNIIQRIGNSLIPIVVEIGRTTITTGELLHLQKGDVIALDSKVAGEADVLIVDRPKFYARPGMVGDKLAVVITDVRREEDGNG